MASTDDPRLSAGRIGIGVNYPGLGLRCFVIDSNLLELRMQFASGVRVPSLRAARYINAIARVYPFVGAEVAYATYKSKITDAKGSVMSLYLGGEYYIKEKVSLQLDFGIAYVSLGEAKYKYTVSGMEFVTNIGLTYYFGGK